MCAHKPDNKGRLLTCVLQSPVAGARPEPGGAERGRLEEGMPECVDPNGRYEDCVDFAAKELAATAKADSELRGTLADLDSQ